MSQLEGQSRHDHLLEVEDAGIGVDSRRHELRAIEGEQ